jgi:hypothetical protein
LRLLLTRAIVAACISSPGVLASAQNNAFGEGTITGTVTDTSGSALRGVTVEAYGPSLIEKVQRALTDESGRYRISRLPSGIYTVTFRLQGFTERSHQGVVLEGSGVRTVEAEMVVGTFTDTVTVSREAPAIDVYSTTREHVISQSLSDSLPVARYPYALAGLVPGVVPSTRDVGDANGYEFDAAFPVHGGRPQDQRIKVNGFATGPLIGPQFSNTVPNPEGAREIVIVTAASGAEEQTGGVIVDYIPHDGANRFQGSIFVSGAGGGMQSSNLTQDLVNQGALASPDTLDKTWEVNPTIGGPFVRDRLWGFYAFRKAITQTWANQFYNRNAFQPANYTIDLDPSRPARSRNGAWTDNQFRVTWQVNARNKIAFFFSDQIRCDCPGLASTTRTPEAGANDSNPKQRTYQLEHRWALSDKLLAEFAGQRREIEQAVAPLTLETSGASAAAFSGYEQSIGVTILDGQGVYPNGLITHGPGPPTILASNAGGPFSSAKRPVNAFRASMTYQAGSHTLKFGVQDTFGYAIQQTYLTTVDSAGRPQPFRYTFSNLTTPQQVTVYSGTRDAPLSVRNELDLDLGIYAEDSWTMKRLTARAGIRYDRYKSSYPEQALPETPFGRPATTFAAGENLDLQDVVPRFGVSYDLLGDGKTAIKFTLNKYVQSQSLAGLGGSGNPLAAGRGLINTFTRNWRDDDGDYVVDCDVFARDPNGECTNAIAPNVLNVDPSPLTDTAVRHGWGRRPFNWELSLGVQRELWRGVALDVSYFRRSFGNFFATNDTACVDPQARTGCREPGNYRSFDIAVPVDSRLPGGGGYMLTGFLDPDCSGPAANCGAATAADIAALPSVNEVILVKDLGVTQIENWNGVDVSLRVIRRGLVLLGGISTGRRYTNECGVWAALPEMQNPGGQSLLRPLTSCEVKEPFRTVLNGFATYTVPRPGSLPGWLARIVEDVQLAGTVKSIPGNEMSASYAMTNEEFARGCPSGLADTSCSNLGRFLANQTQPSNNRQISLLPPASVYDDRHNQVDLRIGRDVRLGRSRMSVNLDIFNAFNANPVLGRNNLLGQSATPGDYAAAQQPQADGGYNSLWVPTNILQPRFARISATLDF